jgi:hypothetical protein
MNDPEIADEPLPLREVHAMRLMIYDQIKDMTPGERFRFSKERADLVMKKYNLNYVNTPKYSAKD